MPAAKISAANFSEIVLRPVAEELHVAVVPAAAQIVGNAVHGNEVIMRMIDAAPHELDHVPVTDPGQKLPRVGRPVRIAERADAQAGDGEAVFIGIEPADRFAEHLGDAVTRVRPRHHAVVDEALAAVKADRMV